MSGLLPRSLTQKLSRMDTRTDTKRAFHNEYSNFHEVATFCGIWCLVILLAPSVLAAMRTILVPLLWAFFLMMGLLPLTDFLERILLRCFAILHIPRCPPLCRRFENMGSSDLRLDDDEEDDLDTDPEDEGESYGASTAGMQEEGKCRTARMIAVLITITLFVGVVWCYLLMFYRSAVHIKDDIENYVKGAERYTAAIEWLKEHLPAEVLDRVFHQFVASAEEYATIFVSGMFENISVMVMEGVMILLYMMFWLCDPIDIAEDVATVFQRYILLKGLASLLYALAIWLLLHCLSVDLSIVFATITFMFNFIPEVGPFIAMLLPLPVILLDARQESPVATFTLAIVGMLALKFIFGNIVEVLLVERQRDMRMHPVIILFGVAFFGWIWGATGMLLSVPIVAAGKAMVHVIPRRYRDSILIFLEGSKTAPAKWEESRERTLSDEQAPRSRNRSLSSGHASAGGGANGEEAPAAEAETEAVPRRRHRDPPATL